MSATATEIEAALTAIRRASAACLAVQERIAGGDDVVTKGDDSPVTAADFAAQAAVCATLVEHLGDGLAIVGEEDATDLRSGDAGQLVSTVQEITAQALGRSVSADDVVDWIGLGSANASSDRFWTLDPIDGTKGFLRNDQFAVALGLIEDGEVVLGVLGCPNLPNDDGTKGAVFVADADATSADLAGSGTMVPVSVRRPPRLSDARFCESVESGHSDHDQSKQIADRLGIASEPYRIDSQCKYAAVARGDASIYLRLPTRADYVEKIWDHAAGKLVVERAGGTVTDVEGRPLDFSHGVGLAANSGVVATAGAFHEEVIDAVRSVLADG